MGLAIENRLQELLGLLIRAKYAKEKAGLLSEVDIGLEILRFKMRMAKDLKVLPIKSHGYAAETMQGIGSQVGGWMKSKGRAE